MALDRKAKDKAKHLERFYRLRRISNSRKFTSPKNLVIHGTSAGGILISNSLAERSKLFAAKNTDVGMTNILRAETTANGVVNVPQCGSVKAEAGFRAVLAMDGYLKIKDGVRYPAVLFSYSINDARCPKDVSKNGGASASGLLDRQTRSTAD
jgi:prolyl oligopeptidase PreP (S9A serine peptidase family)